MILTATLCGYKRDPKSSRPPCALALGHTGSHSYNQNRVRSSVIAPHAATLIDYDAVPRSTRPSKEEIEAAKTPNGGWTRATLAQWGVPWPPPKGWKKALTS